VQCLVRLTSQLERVDGPYRLKPVSKRPVRDFEARMGALCRSGPLNALGEQDKAVTGYIHSGGRDFTVQICLLDGGNKGLGSAATAVGHVWCCMRGTSEKFCVWSMLVVCRWLLRSLDSENSNVHIRPVLKHGPRSLTCMRVVGWKT
jgi:hypothetical protein